jgi:hypothetical protein
VVTKEAVQRQNAETSRINALRNRNEQEETKKAFVGNIKQSTDKKGNPLKVSTSVSGQQGKATEYTLKSPVEVGIGDAIVTVNNYYIGDDGTISYTGKRKSLKKTDKIATAKTIDDETKETITTPSEEVWVPVNGKVLNDTEANAFAVSLGFDDQQDLIDYTAGTSKLDKLPD